MIGVLCLAQRIPLGNLLDCLLVVEVVLGPEVHLIRDDDLVDIRTTGPGHQQMQNVPLPQRPADIPAVLGRGRLIRLLTPFRCRQLKVDERIDEIAFPAVGLQHLENGLELLQRTRWEELQILLFRCALRQSPPQLRMQSCRKFLSSSITRTSLPSGSPGVTSYSCGSLIVLPFLQKITLESLDILFELPSDPCGSCR